MSECSRCPNGFVSPEAYRTCEDVGPHSDVFALAVTLYYLVSRRLLFHVDNEFGWIFAVAGNMEAQAPRISDVRPGVSAGLSDIIAEGLQKMIPQRYVNAADMKWDLEERLKCKCPVSQSLPATWKDMDSPWKDVELVDIKSGEPESTEVFDLFYATVRVAHRKDSARAESLAVSPVRNTQADY